MKSEKSWSRIVHVRWCSVAPNPGLIRSRTQGATKEKNMVSKYKYAKPLFQAAREDPAAFAIICRCLQIRVRSYTSSVRH
jgi:hypothetical protein